MRVRVRACVILRRVAERPGSAVSHDLERLAALHRDAGRGLSPPLDGLVEVLDLRQHADDQVELGVTVAQHLLELVLHDLAGLGWCIRQAS